MVTTTTHLNFRGTARAALEFYRSVSGGEIVLRTYGDLGMPADAPDADHVVFGTVTAGNGFRVMAYDVPGAGADSAPVVDSTRRENGMTITDATFFVSVRGETFAEVQGFWDGLSVGAATIEPFAASQWSSGFGMLTDRFGVTWVLDVAS